MDRKFWKAAFVRAIRTVAQTAVATIGSTVVIEEVRWLMVLSAAALAGILSLLTSIATGLPETEPEIVYREVNENGLPTDGHYVTVIAHEEED